MYRYGVSMSPFKTSGYQYVKNAKLGPNISIDRLNKCKKVPIYLLLLDFTKIGPKGRRAPSGLRPLTYSARLEIILAYAATFFYFICCFVV